MLRGNIVIFKSIFILFSGCFFSYMAAAQNKAVRLPAIPFPLSWENKPLNYSVKGTVLTIRAGAKTDMFRDPNVTYNTDNAPKLLFTADNDFVLTARIEHPFNNKWDGGAIVLKADALHWIKFC